jgi:hypothetical protein
LQCLLRSLTLPARQRTTVPRFSSDEISAWPKCASIREGFSVRLKGADTAATVYQQVLGDRFALLHPLLQAFLGADCVKRAQGRMQVIRSGGWLRNSIATLMGIPPGGPYDVCLEVSPVPGGERWRRRFGEHALETVQSVRRGLLAEASGPASLGFELLVQDGGLLFRRRRAWLCGIPLPLWLAPKIEAENMACDGAWSVCVRFGVPVLGEVGRYEGDVGPEAA